MDLVERGRYSFGLDTLIAKRSIIEYSRPSGWNGMNGELQIQVEES